MLNWGMIGYNYTSIYIKQLGGFSTSSEKADINTQYTLSKYVVIEIP